MRIKVRKWQVQINSPLREVYRIRIHLPMFSLIFSLREVLFLRGIYLSPTWLVKINKIIELIRTNVNHQQWQDFYLSLGDITRHMYLIVLVRRYIPLIVYLLTDIYTNIPYSLEDRRQGKKKLEQVQRRISNPCSSDDEVTS